MKHGHSTKPCRMIWYLMQPATILIQIQMNVATPSSFISENNQMCLSALFQISHLEFWIYYRIIRLKIYEQYFL